MNEINHNSSGFISKDSHLENIFSEIKPFYSSSDGYSQLYTVRRHGRLFILKGLKSTYREDIIYHQLLQKEYEIAYFLDHPNICKILGWEEIPTYGPCILMEYIDGEDLHSFIQKHSLDIQTIKKILNEICDALNYIHSKQIVHRDLKPENILITYIGQNVKLIDFGFSDSSDYKILKVPAGTLNYMSPEQKKGNTIDGRTDIYSLGIVIKNIIQVFPNSDLQKIADKCTKEKCDERYVTVHELQHCIQRIKEDKQRSPILPILIVLLLLFISLLFFYLNSKGVQDMKVSPSTILNENELIL